MTTKSARYLAKRRAEFREWIDRAKLDAGCADCGYRAHAVALTYWHRDDTQDRIWQMARDGRSREMIEAEMAQCDVVCANCRRVRRYTLHSGDG